MMSKLQNTNTCLKKLKWNNICAQRLVTEASYSRGCGENPALKFQEMHVIGIPSAPLLGEFFLLFRSLVFLPNIQDNC